MGNYRWTKKELKETSMKTFVRCCLEDRMRNLNYRTPLRKKIEEAIKAVLSSNLSEKEIEFNFLTRKEKWTYN